MSSSVDVKSAVKAKDKLCSNGKGCQFLKLGTCKFNHAAQLPKLHQKVVAKRVNSTAKDAARVMVKHHAPKIMKLSQSIARAKVVSDAFIDVKTGQSKSSWADTQELLDLQEQLSNMKNVARSSIGGSHIRSILYSGGSGASSANAAVAGSIGIAPSAALEWSSYASLYDEVKVTKLVIHYAIGFTAASTAIPAGGCVFASVGYDSTYNSTPTSVADVMESDQHQIVGAQVALTGAVIPNKLHRFEVNIPRGPVANSSSVTGGVGLIANFPGEWMAVGDTTPDTVGYFRFYVEAGGATCVMGYRLITEYHCEFRERT